MWVCSKTKLCFGGAGRAASSDSTEPTPKAGRYSSSKSLVKHAADVENGCCCSVQLKTQFLRLP